MASYMDCTQIITLAVRIEKKLKDFYDVAEIAMQSPDSKAAIVAIKAKLVEKLSVLEGIQPEKFGKPEWLKFVPSLREQDVIPKGRITRVSPPDEIFAQMLASEEKLRDYYRQVSTYVTARALKDLFDSLTAFKTEQIEGIKRLMLDKSA